MSAEFLNTDFEKVSYLEKILTSRATNGDVSDSEYQKLRYELLSNNNIASLLPSWLKPHKSLDLLWGAFGSYPDRRKFLSEEFSPVLNVLEFGHTIEMKKMPEAFPPRIKSSNNKSL